MTVSSMISPSSAVYAKGTTGLPTPVDDQGNGLPISTPTGFPIATNPSDGAFGTGTVTSAATLFTVGPLTFGDFIEVQVTSAGTTCTVTYESSIDGVTYITAVGIPSNNATTVGPGTTSGGLGSNYFARSTYFRARVTIYGSGTVTALYRITSANMIASAIRVVGFFTGAAVIANSPAATETQNTLALTGSAQTIIASNANRKNWWIQNNSGVTVYVNVGGTASSSDGKSMVVTNGATVSENGSGAVSTQAISIVGASGSVAYAEGV